MNPPLSINLDASVEVERTDGGWFLSNALMRVFVTDLLAERLVANVEAAARRAAS